MRGVDAPFILADLEESFERDLKRGVPLWSARRRHAINVVGSVLNTWRSNPWFPGWTASWIDVKLSFRMLFKHPGLTLVAVFALAIGIPVGLLPMHILESLRAPMPVPDGDEIVMVRNWDVIESRAVRRPIHDFVQWRQDLKSFEDLGFVRRGAYNFISEDGRAAPVKGAEVTASVFSLLRVPPLLGRPLNEADEIIGAPKVVVIGYDLWRSRLAGEPNIVGTTIRIGSVPHTVVGIMPEGFLFPIRGHLWFPLRYNPLDFARGSGPHGWIMGRLAKGASIEGARLELEVMGQRMATEFPESHGHLQPQVLPYTSALLEVDTFSQEVLFVEFLALLLLILACSNVGILILARAATRSREIAIRTALGAGRARVVGQLFTESLLLAVVAAGVGLGIGQIAAIQIQAGELSNFLPFWLDFQVTPRTVIFALSLAIGSAAVAGVVPALKATGKHVQVSVQRASGGRSGIRFGMASSCLIVAEVAVAVFFLTLGSALVPAALAEPDGLGIETENYLYARLRIPWVDPAASQGEAQREEFRARIRYAHIELKRRLDGEPGSGSVAIASRLPGMIHKTSSIEFEGEATAPGSRGIKVHMARVDIDYFKALDQPILGGRGFGAADLGESRSAIVVNTDFVERALGGKNPIGRRLRYTSSRGWDSKVVIEPSPWYEIIGVVGPLGMNPLNPAADVGIYHPVAPGELHPVSFAIRVSDEPQSFTPRLRAIAEGIDPSAMIQNPMALDRVSNEHRLTVTWMTFLVGLLAFVAVTLSASGLYALMSFTVAERTHEIGVRTALGAQPGKIVAAIARRACLQLGIGVVLGVGLCVLTLPGIGDMMVVVRASNWPLMAVFIALAVVVVGILACVSPTRRCLRIRPMEALKTS